MRFCQRRASTGGTTASAIPAIVETTLQLLEEVDTDEEGSFSSWIKKTRNGLNKLFILQIVTSYNTEKQCCRSHCISS